MRYPSAILAFVILSTFPASGQSWKKLPETFAANAQVKTMAGAAAAALNITVERYSRDEDRNALLKEFSSGGAVALTAALRKAPAVGYLEVNGKKFPIQFARQQESDKGRRILVVVAEPIYFVGGGDVNAKPRDGFDLAVVQFAVDTLGLGEGTIAAAARVKAGNGPDGLELQDYAAEPIKLVTVRRLYK